MSAKNTKTKTQTVPEYAIVPSPVGDLLLVAADSALMGVYFCGRDHVPAAWKQWKLNHQNPVLMKAAQQLKQYFARKRETFSLPLRMNGTAFQTGIWKHIARIPYGETLTYTELARRAGAPEAIRAAGTTTGRNPLSIVIPCHRVIGKNGSLCGFAGGLEKKRHLLELERRPGS